MGFTENTGMTVVRLGLYRMFHSSTKDVNPAMNDSGEQMEVRILTKEFGLMVNLFNSYFEEIPCERWQQLIEIVSLQQEIISTIIQEEDGPIRKKKAERAMANFTLTVNDYNLQNKTAA